MEVLLLEELMFLEILALLEELVVPLEEDVM